MPDASQADTQEFSRAPVFNKVAMYLVGQPFGNMLSLIVIAGFGYWFWWSQTTGDDQKAKRLQDAFAAIHAENAKTVVEVAAKHGEAVKFVAEQHSSVVKAMLDHAEAAGKRREKESERTEQFLREFVRPIPGPIRPALGKKDDGVGAVAEKPEPSPSGLAGQGCE